MNTDPRRRDLISNDIDSEMNGDYLQDEDALEQIETEE